MFHPGAIYKKCAPSSKLEVFTHTENDNKCSVAVRCVSLFGENMRQIL